MHHQKQVIGGQIYNILKSHKLEFLSTCLPDHSHKAGAQTKQCTATILHHNNQLTGGMCLLGFQQVCALCSLSLISFYLDLALWENPYFGIQQNNYYNIPTRVHNIRTIFINSWYQCSDFLTELCCNTIIHLLFHYFYCLDPYFINNFLYTSLELATGA